MAYCLLGSFASPPASVGSKPTYTVRQISAGRAGEASNFTVFDL